jgi:aspartate aminotransferase
MHLRDAIRDLRVSRIAEIAALGMGDPAVIPLWYGEGDLPTPGFIGQAASAALAAGHTFYTHKAGLPELRAAIAEYLSALHARPVAAERILVSSAAMNGLMLVAETLIDPGDNLVIVAPIWPNIAASVAIMGGEPRLVSLDPAPGGGWRLDLDRLFAACDARTRGIFVNSPANPTGWVATADDIAALIQFSRQRGLWLMADEVYSRIVYGNRAAPSFLDQAEPEDRLIVVNSFSKNWAMTGWRLGWLVLPPDLFPEIEKLVEFNTSGSPTFLQHAAIVAIREGEDFIAGFVARCRAARDIAIDALQGFRRVEVAWPAGAFYAFPRIDGITDSLAFAKEILHRTKVGLAPGSAFGPMGEGYLRMCFARDPQQIADAVERRRVALPQVAVAYVARPIATIWPASFATSMSTTPTRRPARRTVAVAISAVFIAGRR